MFHEEDLAFQAARREGHERVTANPTPTRCQSLLRSAGRESRAPAAGHFWTVSVVDGIQPPPREDGHSARPIFPPITDVVAGGVVVPTVHLAHLRSVEVHRDRQAVARVPYPVNASVVG